MEKYSKKLFKAAFNKIENELVLGEKIVLKGLWTFSYLEGANALQSVYFNHTDKEKLLNEYPNIINEIEDTRLDCDYGSLGFSFRNLKNDSTKFVDFLPDTFNDAKGTVCYYDTLINQQHACFVIIRNDEEILGALDFFFTGTNSRETESIIKSYFSNNKSVLLPDFINAFKIQEFEYFLEIQSEKRETTRSEDTSFKADLRFAIEHIEQLLALSSKTPLMIINRSNGNISPSLVCLNFDYIHSIIIHEHRFCPLTNSNKDCFHFKNFTAFDNNSNLKCDNEFLKNYYYKVFIALNSKLLHQNINVDGIEYEIEIVHDKNSSFELKMIISINDEYNDLYFEGLNELAKEKYRDERVFMLIEEEIKKHDDIYVLSLSRKVPSLKCNINCNENETDCQVRNKYVTDTPLKQFISPSNILPIQYEDKKDGQFVKDIKDSANNIVHFKIVNKEKFTDTLKRLIAINPDYYIEIIKPYINNEITTNTAYDHLALKYAGTNPLERKNKYAEIIKGKLNLIETILQGEESESLATRAAISQVMTRNNSHNIGAHVMNKLIGDLSQLSIKDFKNYVSKIDLYKEETDNNKILLDQISIFNNYVKCRMDYLADISFGTPLMQTNKFAYSDLFKELDNVRLLLEHISGLSENFKFSIRFLYNGEEMNNKKDLLVAIPNDILGMQAFYNILENIIRNTAKHAKAKPGQITFTVNFSDELKSPTLEQANILNDFIVVEVYDNCPVEGEGIYLTEDEKKEFVHIGMEAPEKFDSEIDHLVFSQNCKINADILEDNKLRSSALGVIEMDASATYLRKRDVSYINHSNYDILYDNSWSRNSIACKNDDNKRGTDCRHFLKAFKTTEVFEVEIGNSGVKKKIKGPALGYRFFLLRPVVVLIVADINIDDDTNNKGEYLKELKKRGIWVVSPVKFHEHLKANKVYNHEFVLYQKKSKGEQIEEIDIPVLIERYKTSLPVRILEETEVTYTIENLLKKTANEIADCCWSMWYNKELISAITCKQHTAQHKVPFSIANTLNSRACYNIVILDHLYSDNGKTPQQQWQSGLAADHLEALSSLAQSKMPDFNTITNSPHRGEVEKFKYYIGSLPMNTRQKIIEASLTKVIVIDERIQEAAEKRDFEEIDFKDLYAKMNVIVPDKTSNKCLNLSANSLSNSKVCIEEYIQDEINKAKPTDFILIHYSILERMYKKAEINKKLEEWIYGTDTANMRKSKINIVITSGRGIPDNLSEKVRFVNLSSVINTFIDIRCKFGINYLLNSSRKSNKI